MLPEVDEVRTKCYRYSAASTAFAGGRLKWCAGAVGAGVFAVALEPAGAGFGFGLLIVEMQIASVDLHRGVQLMRHVRPVVVLIDLDGQNRFEVMIVHDAAAVERLRFYG